MFGILHLTRLERHSQADTLNGSIKFQMVTEKARENASRMQTRCDPIWLASNWRNFCFSRSGVCACDHFISCDRSFHSHHRKYQTKYLYVFSLRTPGQSDWNWERKAKWWLYFGLLTDLTKYGRHPKPSRQIEKYISKFIPSLINTISQAGEPGRSVTDTLNRFQLRISLRSGKIQLIVITKYFKRKCVDSALLTNS